MTFAVPDALLSPCLPPGLAFDRLDGSALVSLVAFDFRDTRVRGLAFPGLVNFPELNLRIYVRHGDRRGVTFVREFVRSRLVAWTAWALYNEPYRTLPMVSTTETDGSSLRIEHRLTVGGREQRIQIEVEGTATTPPADSREHFLKEQVWGFGRLRNGTLVRYRVDHPAWRVYPAPRVTLDVDFGALYGPQWTVLNERAPLSVVLAEGSEVTVWPAEPALASGSAER